MTTTTLAGNRAVYVVMGHSAVISQLYTSHKMITKSPLIQYGICSHIKKLYLVKIFADGLLKESV